jgi:outer membrane protein assembly factor BamB
MAAPVLYGDRLAVCGLDGGLYLLDPVSGQPSASYRLGAPIAASPCAVDGGLCVGTWDGRLYRLAL